MSRRSIAATCREILAYTADLDRQLRTFKAVLEKQTQEALDEQRARDAALAAGQPVAFAPPPPRRLIITDLGRHFTVEASGDAGAATVRSLSALAGRVYDWAATPRTPEAAP